MFQYHFLQVTIYNKFSKKLSKKYLEVGQGVMAIASKEMGTVKYIGHADFAPGIWIGLELRNPKGDGQRHVLCHTIWQ